ncbi:hypothetical protein KN246_15830 [Mycobacterium intracellulare]|uniref:hypothetical protein n=1 Tax=Mycobacterium intracellulare TaxID=1767 RepID=UPI001E5E63A4|nr:hypothetical protein [Mycobacterium intracellulare]UGT94859.1 hypothetical protein LTQ55_13750 [Mycobacterium intracellulare]UQB95735.1 hypothetical protein KN246_15830 [Mycobacterium intracellulare]
MTTDYYAALEADRAATKHGTSAWSAPRHEHTNPGQMSPKDLEKPAPFTLKAPQSQAVQHRAGATAAQRAWASKQNALTAIADHIEAIEPAVHDPRYTYEQVRETVKEFTDTPAYQDAVRQHEAVHAKVEDAQHTLAQERAALTQPGDAAAESRALRYWARTERLLDASNDGIGAAHEIIGSATPEQLSVLAEELAPYLKAKGHDTSWLDDAFAEKVPSLGAAQRRLVAAQQAAMISDGDMRRLNDMLRQGPSPDGLRPQRIPAIAYDRRYDPEVDL